jgi:hypothetical protein
MKKVLFVLGAFLNKTSQNGICIENIAQFLKKDGVKCHFLCIEESISNNNKIDDDTFIVTKEQKGTLFRKIIKLFNKFFHVPHNDITLINKLYNSIVTLDQNNDYDSIISVINPTESAEAVRMYKLKKKNFKFMIYEIDPASNRFKKPYNPFEVYWKKISIMWERKIYSSADIIVHMISHFSHFKKDIYKNFINKSFYLDIPNLKLDSSGSKLNINDYRDGKFFSFIYAGKFYPKLRNPNYMIKTLSRVNNFKKIDVNIYTGNNMLKNIIKINKSLKNMFITNSMIPQDQLDTLILNSNFVISVGNKNSDFFTI